MNAQEIFDTVSTHLFTQGERAVKPTTGQCMYRTESGLKCAVGCLIPDDMYTPSIEGHGVDNLFCSLPNFEVFKYHRRLLMNLQILHDEGIFAWDSTIAMRRRLQGIAEEHGLNSSILDSLSFKDR